MIHIEAAAFLVMEKFQYLYVNGQISIRRRVHTLECMRGMGNTQTGWDGPQGI